jgi:hypothetical protein
METLSGVIELNNDAKPLTCLECRFFGSSATLKREVERQQELSHWPTCQEVFGMPECHIFANPTLQQCDPSGAVQADISSSRSPTSVRILRSADWYHLFAFLPEILRESVRRRLLPFQAEGSGPVPPHHRSLDESLKTGQRHAMLVKLQWLVLAVGCKGRTRLELPADHLTRSGPSPDRVMDRLRRVDQHILHEDDVFVESRGNSSFGIREYNVPWASLSLK